MRVRIEQLPTIPLNSNPFHYDLTQVGTIVSNELLVLTPGQSNVPSMDVVHVPSGERIRIHFDSKPPLVHG